MMDVHCEVAEVKGWSSRHLRWVPCKRRPSWRLQSTVNPEVVTHCCNVCLAVFNPEIEAGLWQAESLTVTSWSN